MGRKKIQIRPIKDEKNRMITFNKRKTGLLKKAAELAMLCKIQLYLAFTDTENNIILFQSPNTTNKDDVVSFIKRGLQSEFQLTYDDYPDFKSEIIRNQTIISKQSKNRKGQSQEFSKNKKVKKSEESSQSSSEELDFASEAQKNENTFQEDIKQEEEQGKQQVLQKPIHSFKIKIPEKNRELEQKMCAIKIAQQQQLQQLQFIKPTESSNSNKASQDPSQNCTSFRSSLQSLSNQKQQNPLQSNGSHYNFIQRHSDISLLSEFLNQNSANLTANFTCPQYGELASSNYFLMDQKFPLSFTPHVQNSATDPVNDQFSLRKTQQY